MIRIFLLLVALLFFFQGIIIFVNGSKESQAFPSVPVNTSIFEPECDEGFYLFIGQSFIGNHQIAEVTTCVEAESQSDTEADRPAFFVLKQEETLSSILQAKSISQAEIHELALSINPHLRAKDLTAGDLYRYGLSPLATGSNTIDWFEIQKLDQNRIPILYTITATGDGPAKKQFSLKVKKPQVLSRLTKIEVEIKN